jgi:nicotinamidase-related amidase
MSSHLMQRAQSQLLVVDIQEKLLGTIHAVDHLIARTHFLVTTARHLDVPITISEQYPKGLGATEASLKEAAGNASPIFAKTAFSCLKDDALRDHLATHDNRKQLVIVGMEAHVCVLQTALDAREAGYQVFVASDAISSRAESDVSAARHRLADAGVTLITTEMAFFEWLERSGTPEFKALSPMLK